MEAAKSSEQFDPKVVYATWDENDEAVMEDIERKLDDPKTSIGEKIKLRALRVVNKIRLAAGAYALADMPKGVTGDSTNCPVFNALRVLDVKGIDGGSAVEFYGSSPAVYEALSRPELAALNGDIEYIEAESGEVTVKLARQPDGPSSIAGLRAFTDPVDEFVRTFDRSQFPELAALKAADEDDEEQPSDLAPMTMERPEDE